MTVLTREARTLFRFGSWGYSARLSGLRLAVSEAVPVLRFQKRLMSTDFLNPSYAQADAQGRSLTKNLSGFDAVSRACATPPTSLVAAHSYLLPHKVPINYLVTNKCQQQSHLPN